MATTNITSLCNYLILFNDKTASPQQKSTVIKYTKIPNIETDKRVLRVSPQVCSLAFIDKNNVQTTRSLKSSTSGPSYITNTKYSKKKVLPTEEQEKLQRTLIKVSPQVCRLAFIDNNNVQTTRSLKSTTSGPSYTTNTKYSKKKVLPIEEQEKPQRTSRNLVRHTLQSAVIIDLEENKQGNKERNVSSKFCCSRKNEGGQSNRPNSEKKISKVITQDFKRKNISKKNLPLVKKGEMDVCLLQKKTVSSIKFSASNKKHHDNKTNQNSPRVPFPSSRKCFSVIYVPIEEPYRTVSTQIEDTITDKSNVINNLVELQHFAAQKDTVTFSKSVFVEADLKPEVKDVSEGVDLLPILAEVESQSKIVHSLDPLQVPDVTLIKDKSDLSKEVFSSESLPKLKVPSVTIIPQTDDCEKPDDLDSSAAFLVGSTTVTYSTKEEMNFKLLSSDEVKLSVADSLAYPVTVISAMKQDSKTKIPLNSGDKENKSNTNMTNRNERTCPFDESHNFNSLELIKPSQLISTIRLNSSLLNNGEYLCEQFQRELNFIDSYLESLQYLDNYILSDKLITNQQAENWINNNQPLELINGYYNNYMCAFDNDVNTDNETMASRSLLLLNSLIRDEQRRAKNLLFVLKMREDALKDFTKSQILWLENKKKQDNIDIPTLKKKQRGALLKLQYECGEMQRMRKALLALTEKRKAALMKTKKNIELKIKNNVNVEQMLLGRKKTKRFGCDRHIAPVKCFDLSSSGYDECFAHSSQPQELVGPSAVDSVNVSDLPGTHTEVTSAEKSIQTGDSILGRNLSQCSTNTTEENFVVVDGSYLNILFLNLSLPQIFSGGKQYEVNENALRNIVNLNNAKNTDWISRLDRYRFMDLVKKYRTEVDSTPSTARSLVEEFDQYYKDLSNEDKLLDVPKKEYSEKCCESRSVLLQTVSTESIEQEDVSDCVPIKAETSFECNLDEQDVPAAVELSGNQAGPLTVPVGAPVAPDAVSTELPVLLSSTKLTSETCSTNQSQSNVSLASPVVEAEELRKQQIEIEKEIKALEQEQSQLLIVREIPDKPPPPYTPPSEGRASKQVRLFVTDNVSDVKIQAILSSQHASKDCNDSFDEFLNDYCLDVIERQNKALSDEPWDSCNLSPQKQELDSEKLVKKTRTDLQEVLTGVPPTVVAGVSGRRSDHIDDILFAEWRRCEPEWTALQADEAIVKNQLFDCIFQRLLSETVDEYKRTVIHRSSTD